MPSPRPRPILKPLPSPAMTSTSPLPFSSSSSHVYPLDSPHVHFPPTPTMAQMQITHSSSLYDRKPITVVPNSCALPERGDREVNIASPIGSDNGDAENRPSSCMKRPKGGYFHPSAYEAFEYEGQESPSSSRLRFDDDDDDISFTAQHNTRAGPRHRRNNSSTSRPQSTPHHRLVPPPLVFDSSESSDCSELGSPPELPAQPNPAVAFSHPYHFAQHLPNVDLKFLSPLDASPRFKRRQTHGDRVPPLSDRESSRAPKEGKSTSRTRNSSTSRLERTKKAASNVSCAGFGTGFCDPPLEGCLGGF